MTSTEATAESWSDVQKRLNAAAAADYAAVQQELEEAEAEHRRLTEAAIMGTAEVGPLDLQRVESRKQLAEMRLVGLQESQRIRRNAAAEAHRATVRAKADAVMAKHAGAGDQIEAAQQKIVDAIAEIRAVVGAYNADVSPLLDDALGAFTVSVRQESLAEMETYRDELTQQPMTRPKLRAATSEPQLHPIYGRFEGEGDTHGIEVRGWRVEGDKVRTRPSSITVDGLTLEPVDMEKTLLTGIEHELPAKLQEAAVQVTGRRLLRGSEWAPTTRQIKL